MVENKIIEHKMSFTLKVYTWLLFFIDWRKENVSSTDYPVIKKGKQNLSFLKEIVVQKKYIKCEENPRTH